MNKDITLKILIKKALQFVNETDTEIYTFLRRAYLYSEKNTLLLRTQKIGHDCFKQIQYKPNKKTFYIISKGQKVILQDIKNNFPPLVFGVSL